jgi:hypothetical protein
LTTDSHLRKEPTSRCIHPDQVSMVQGFNFNKGKVIILEMKQLFDLMHT